MRYVCLLTCSFAASVAAQNLGAPPTPGIGPTDITAAFRLPPLPDATGSPLQLAVAALQVGSRAKTLGLTDQSASEAWRQVETLLTPRTPSDALVPANIVVFSGTTASALNQLIIKPGVSSIQVTSGSLSIDQPLEIQRSGLLLDLGSAQITSANPQPYMVRIDSASSITLLHGSFVSGNSAILVNQSNTVTVSGAQIANLTGAGIVVTSSSQVTVTHNQISAGQLAGIVVHRGTTNSIVEHNEITGNLGFANLMAGIVVSDREVDIASNPLALLGPDGYWVVQQPMSQRIHPPHDDLIAWNHVAQNSSSGIYLDGATRIVVYSNSIVGNSKEGLCLDNGSTANVISSNIVQQNGQRWGETDAILALDSVLGGGRLPDGTPAEKVPGISLDNAIYNIVFANNVLHNFGGGVKMVRTGYFNEVGLNVLLDDNDGAGAVFHFFGVELGAASGSSIELNFTPSRGNVVFSNSIRGTHYSGIYFDPGSDTNNIFDNTIMDATNWALESAAQMNNITLNNLTNLPSRNIGSGLSPVLITLGQPVNDP
jgi:parallel beta-helix repeat protein